METETFTILTLGFVLGVKHALDADHLIAVATIVSEGRRVLSSTITGALWGMGHTAALLIVGCLLVALQIKLPATVALSMEFGVALMLVILGIHVLWKLLRGDTLHVHVHRHHGHTHVHPHTHQHAGMHEHESDHSYHASPLALFLQRVFRNVNANKRSILIGMVHGLAGSAALMLIVLATISDTQLALLYIGVFGIGSIGGMMMMSTLIGLPFVIARGASSRLQYLLRATAGVVSIAFGLFLAWHIGVVEGLFLLK